MRTGHVVVGTVRQQRPGNASGFNGALSAVIRPLLILDWAGREGGVDNEDVIG